MRANQTLVSVIIPAHNASAWISESIASACDQTWPDVEIIVIDDGSTDETVEVVSEIPDDRVRLIRQDNLGAASARNAGTRESRGAFVQYLDADDILSRDKIELQLSALSNAPEGSIASCAWTHFDGKAVSGSDAFEPVWNESDPFEWLIRSYSGEGMMQPAGWLTPHSLISAAGRWNEALSLHDDGDFFLRVLLRARQNIFVAGPTVFYRTVDKSLSRKRTRPAIESAFEVCQSKDKHLLAARDEPRTRIAVASQYGQFAYEFSGSAPDLAVRAITRIDELGVTPIVLSGGRPFRLLARSLGLRSALRVRSVLKSADA